MKVLSIGVWLLNDGKLPHLLSISYELSSFGYFQRTSVKEVITFVSREVVHRSNPGQKLSVKNKEYMCHCIVTDKLAVTAITDEEYPSRVIFGVLNQSLDEFTKVHGVSNNNWTTDMYLSTPAIDEFIVKFQNPSEADTIMKIQKDLDDTKGVLVKSIDDLLIRGEKLESLAQKSDDLSMASKTFLNQSEALNSCCVLI